MTKKDQEFRRNMCFTFFEDYRKTAKELEEDFGKGAVADYYNAIIDYALYEEEPELKGFMKYVWHTTKSTIDRSVERRSNGFNGENTEQTEAVLKYIEEHPEASEREIAEAVGCSKGKVGKVKKKYLSNPNTNTITNTNSTSYSNSTMGVGVGTTPHNEGEPSEEASSMPEERKEKRFLKELSSEELNNLSNDYKKGVKYPELYNKYNLCDGELNSKLPATIQSILSDREHKQTITKTKEALDDLDKNTKVDLLEKIGTETPEELVELLAFVGATPQELLEFLRTEDGESFTRDYWSKNKSEDKMDYPSHLSYGFNTYCKA